MPDEPASTKPKPFVFVLMPFDPSFADIYKFGIKGAAEDAGAYAERVDEQIFAEGMLDRIFNQINKADVIVADMTGKNPNVFYEVGYAHALDRVVLLITQSASDIPFDLKHRQHTIYGGSIDTLRHELSNRIKWAITEARRRSTEGDPQRISVRLAGVELIQSPADRVPPMISLATSSTEFHLSLQVRNNSTSGVLEISHLYLFSETGASVVPTSAPTISTQGTVSFYTVAGSNTFALAPSTIPLEPFSPDDSDLQDGLANQYRLPVQLGRMPPRTVESADLHFVLAGGTSPSLYRLRLHTATHIFDFPFQLEISHTGIAK